MLLRCAVLLFCLNFVRTEAYYSGKGKIHDIDERFSLWPSIHNGVRLMRLRKREVEVLKPELTQTTVKPQPADQPVAPPVKPAPEPSKPPGNPVAQPPVSPPASPPASDKPDVGAKNATNKKEGQEEHATDVKVPVKPEQHVNLAANGTVTKTEANATSTETASKINLSDPGVLKRAFIVFGGFALLGTAYYFIFYRKKNANNDAKNQHSSIDPNQFRYGVLQSEDKRNNLELSRVPLTMESDEDEDEDLEIFDLGQKKKSLSYINLQQHDDDIVLNDSRSIDMENLLVDIEDKNSDTLINWSSSGSKSIL